MKKTFAVALMTALILSMFAACPSAAAAGPTENVIVVFTGPVTGQDVKYIESLGGVIKYTYTIIDGIAASLPQSAADQLRRLQGNPGGDPVAGRIKYVEHDGTMYALDGASLAAVTATDKTGTGPAAITVSGY